MKMRRDYFSGRFRRTGDRQPAVGRHCIRALADEYAANYAFTRTYWAAQTVAVHFSNIFFFASYADATRDSQGIQPIDAGFEHLELCRGPGEAGRDSGLAAGRVSTTKAWNKTDASTDTWAALNLWDYYGPVWYRDRVDVPRYPTARECISGWERPTASAKCLSMAGTCRSLVIRGN